MPDQFTQEIARMNKRILVVDDDMDILDFVQPFLNEEGYDVRTSSSGSIFQHVQRDPLDLILLDILLHEKDGRVICQQLKSNELTKRIPVILFSAHVTRENALNKSLADDFIQKPFELRELLEVIKNQLP
jgi:DNA-binding response OmpR family regulator